MKPHIRKTIFGHWAVYRNRQASTYALPVTAATTVRDCWRYFLEYRWGSL